VFRFAANLNMLFGERPFRERFAAAAANGFPAVELLHPYAEPVASLKDRLADHSLECALINTPFTPEAGDFGCAAIAGQEEEFREKIDLALSYAHGLGARAVHVMAGECNRDERNAAAFVANLREAGQSAADFGATILIEPLNPRDRPNYFLRHTDQAREIIEAVALDNVRLQFDIYHVQITEGDLVRRIERLAPLIRHVQVSGVPDRNEPDRGEINLPFVFDALTRAGYSGFVGGEYRPAGRTEDGLGWMRAYRHANAPA
jgi:hydroxypyruvate isomerase